jgi:hypothetical protein
MNKIKLFVVGIFAAILVAGCTSDADVASENISTDADNFKILRRIVAVNGITDNYVLTVEGWCNINDQKTQLEITCKIDGGYKKDFVGLSDNTFYFVEQLQAANVSVDHYVVVFKPSTVIPDVEAR